ncbi:hypothetical protein E4U60_007543 [Claviceps pazoutovae]|uniref:Uncharacterized protein n=1 Tax=Claviceps pazoutovae TaxID=1649127 RepID=A0A9P7SHJ8_9HYPO|nr:hypothetical protein E4U60_007543 [Claviceps pazoutovae]
MSAGRTSRRFRRLEEASSQHQADEGSPVSETAIPTAGGSWRMVEGENSSFDTTILPSPMADNAFGGSRIPVFSGRPSSGPPSHVSSHVSSQVPSQGGHMSASQDSLSDFVKHQDDDRVILRELFRPSVVSPVEPEQDSTQRTPDPQFKMPLMQVDAGRGSDSKSKSIRRMSDENPQEGEGGHLVRRRGQINTGSPSSRKSRPKKTSFHDEHLTPTTQSEQDGPRGSSNIATLLPSALFKILVWAGEIILIALHFAKYPLGMLLAAYLVFGGAIIVQNMATRSVYSALSPVCRLPGLSLLNLPFCPPKNTVLFGDSPSTGGQGHGRSVEFEDLMGVQAKFEQVLEHSAEGVSLPLEMKRSELAVRDLRSLVRHSDVQARHELVLEFDGYIDTARRSSSELQKFNSHVGSAVDAVISINRWTSRYIDSLSPDSALGAGAAGSSVLVEWTQWIFSPFQPADQHMFSERIILEKYIEHTSLVSQRISSLILEAQAVLRLLTKAEDHLGLIYDITSRTSASVSSRREEILWSIWTLVGANSGRLQSLSQQLTLLQQVDAQRSTAVKQVSALILELESIQAGLGDLRDRVAEPQFSGASSAYIPLSVHIETIDRGVDRLQAARRRIRAAEDGRVRDTMAGLRDTPSELIDAGRR